MNTSTMHVHAAGHEAIENERPLPPLRFFSSFGHLQMKAYSLFVLRAPPIRDALHLVPLKSTPGTR
jgi:hypothetical protein